MKKQFSYVKYEKTYVMYSKETFMNGVKLLITRVNWSLIRQIRRRLGKKRTDMSRALGVDLSTAWRYENGEVELSATKLFIIADFLGIEPEALDLKNVENAVPFLMNPNAGALGLTTKNTCQQNRIGRSLGTGEFVLSEN